MTSIAADAAPGLAQLLLTRKAMDLGKEAMAGLLAGLPQPVASPAPAPGRLDVYA